MTATDHPHAAVVDYTDRRGHRSERHVVPLRIAWNGSEWVLAAVDLALGHIRYFAVGRIENWRTASEVVAVDVEKAEEAA